MEQTKPTKLFTAIKQVALAVAGFVIAILIFRNNDKPVKVSRPDTTSKDVEDFLDNKPEPPPQIIQPDFKPSTDIDEAIDKWNS